MIRQILTEIFGFQKFRGQQEKIISSILKKQDTLAVMPTGSGKSLCYQIPGMLSQGTTLIISPLISLMKNQVQALKKKKIRAAYLNSSLSAQEFKETLTAFNKKQLKFLYVAPERLHQKKFIKCCQNINIPLIAIDEAHCISTWGNNFRPAYQQIHCFVNKLKQRPTVTAFTATADEKIISDIIKGLQLNQCQTFIHDLARKNLALNFIRIKNHHHKLRTLLRILEKHHYQSGIIYTATRKDCQYLSQMLNYLLELKPKISFYHGQIGTKKRSQIQTNFISNKTKIITATNAFGMGVDKADIRFIIHYQFPKTVEDYYQEIGRAGRDGKLSHTYLFFHPEDIDINLYLINKTKFSNPQKRETEYIKLQAMIDLIKTKKCKLQTIMKYFDQKLDYQHCGLCSSCYQYSNNLISTKEKKIIRKYQKRIREQNLFNPEIITLNMIKYFALIKPKTRKDWFKIPGIGNGWMHHFYQTFEPIWKKSY